MNSVKRVIEERLSGGRPSPLRGLFAAIVAGVVTATLVYRGLRS